ncbi:3'-5' exonuclease [Roseivirga sp. BDSF3-8]|uniref:3'-5' exonuclease n=1 Tax=Roseivirga sp. BDSF3-8 TaxID=3241598 RepID=UPI003531CF90
MFPVSQLKDIFFIDIETVSCVEEYGLMPPRLQKLWDKKASIIKNEEELSQSEFFFRKAGIFSEFGKVVAIAIGYITQEEGSGPFGLRVKGLADDDEAALLLAFKGLLEKSARKNLLLCGHNGKEFDFPYLSRRMLVNGIPLPHILDVAGKKPWEVAFLDTMEMWKFGDRKNFTSLDLLAAIFDVESSKSALDGSQVNEAYYRRKELAAIKKYCMEDVAVTARVFLKMNCLPDIQPDKIVFVD